MLLSDEVGVCELRRVRNEVYSETEGLKKF